MKRSLVACSSLLTLMLAASSAFAVGNTINWGGCLGSGAASNQVFDCANLGGPYNLALEPRRPRWPAGSPSISLSTSRS